MSPRPRVALITGSSQGIGKAIAQRLAADGYYLALNDVESKRAQLEALAESEEIRGQLEKNTSRNGDGDGKTRSKAVVVVCADVTKEKEVEEMVGKVVEELGSVDVLVANAGVFIQRQVTDLSEEEWTRVMDVNAKGEFFCFKHAARQMIKQGRGGRIIGASSLAGKQGCFGYTAYSMSKFAVRGLIQSAALELGKHSITVNGYAPGAIETDMMRAAYKAAMGIGENEEPDMTHVSKVKELTSSIGEPQDVAHLVSFFASEGSSFVTGQSIVIDGGQFFD